MKKKLEILVVEDDPGHLANAKLAYGEIQKMGCPVSFDYASTLKDAVEMIESRKYDGIVSDIFFPYDYHKESDDSIEGWNSEVARQCEELVGSYIEEFDEEEFTEKERELYQQHQDWKNGKRMHPSGIVVAKMASDRNIPFVLESDIKGHGSVTVAVNQAALDFNNPRVFVNYCHDGRSKKRWMTAYSDVVNGVYLNKNGLSNCGKELRSKVDKENYISFIDKFNVFHSEDVVQMDSEMEFEGKSFYDLKSRKRIANLYD